MTGVHCSSRRGFLWSSVGAAVGAMGAPVVYREKLLQAARQEGGHPLAPRRAHVAARATNLI
ncbi:MAG: hypothetical protein VX311_17995, partial [Planctomycetota bacterium]|nr:hypothetical protein [Planctomycetota bacterium]